MYQIIDYDPSYDPMICIAFHQKLYSLFLSGP